MPKFLTPIDLTLNEVQNGKFHLLATDPGTNPEGRFWYNTSTHVPKFYNGTVVIDLTNPTQLNSQPGSYYLARANHTGTQVAATISDLPTVVQAYRLDQFAAPTGPVNFNSQRLTNVALPTTGTDAANRNYVDNKVAGLSWKDEVQAATTANVSIATGLAAGQVIDGYTLVTGDRVAVIANTDGTQNGFYDVPASGAATRSSDADVGTELTGAAFFVQNGTTNGGKRFVLNNTGVVTVGTTSLTFAQFGAGAVYTFSAPLSLSGNAVSLVLAPRLVNNGSNQLDLASGVVSAGTYSLVTVDTYGRVTAGADLTTGTGLVAKTAAGTFTARTITGSSGRVTVTNGDGVAGNPTFDLATGVIATPGTYSSVTVDTYGRVTAGTTPVALAKYAITIGDGATTAIVVTHNLNSRDVTVSVQDAASYARVYPDWAATSANAVTVSFSVAPTSGQYRVTVIG